MGAFWLVRAELVAAVSEKLGYKSGLALTRQELQEHLPEAEQWWVGTDHEMLRVRAEEFEQGVGTLLRRVGATDSPWSPSPTLALHRKYRHRPDKLKVVHRVIELMIAVVAEQNSSRHGTESGPYDLTPLVERAMMEMGRDGFTIAMELVNETVEHLQNSPWTPFRRQEWTAVEQLANLFKSENLGGQYGHFIDQRFVDYLHRNFESIHRINWRKFEGLVCEYFEREGFRVEIGAGRDDGGIDARVWPATADPSKPPAILIQCKRQKRTIDKVIVKALWADVVAEQASSGLIVTTSTLSPGADAVCNARGYPVRTADRTKLREWLGQMRTPGMGVFLGQ